MSPHYHLCREQFQMAVSRHLHGSKNSQKCTAKDQTRHLTPNSLLLEIQAECWDKKWWTWIWPGDNLNQFHSWLPLFVSCLTPWHASCCICSSCHFYVDQKFSGIHLSGRMLTWVDYFHSFWSPLAPSITFVRRWMAFTTNLGSRIIKIIPVVSPCELTECLLSHYCCEC